MTKWRKIVWAESQKYSTRSAPYQVHRNKVGNALFIAHDCVEDSFPHGRHDAGRAIPVVDPSTQRLVDAR